MSKEIKLGDKVKDLVSGFVGIATQRIECLNGCWRWLLNEWQPKGEKNEFRTIEIDEQQAEKVDGGINKKKKIKKTKTGGPTKMGTMLIK